MTGSRTWLGLCMVILGLAQPAAADGIHTAPVIVQGFKVKPALYHPIKSYRVFRTGADGTATIIPFQIDELNEWGDYVLDEGGDVTSQTGNGIFDLQDELVVMGDDVGPILAPTKWPMGKPNIVFEVRLTFRGTQTMPRAAGAVYVGVYFSANPPAVSPKRYVVFNRPEAEVITSRYRYGFDPKNWLVSRRVEVRPRGSVDMSNAVPVLDSTTFYLKADLKYFLTFEVNHRAINSALEAYKIGPIRAIVRVSFHYTILKLNFELGMYTEISFFSNAVFLPAIMYNPIDGGKSLNRGSGFYYGMSLKDNPDQYKIETNMPSYKESSVLDFLQRPGKVEPMYWVTAAGRDRMLYMEISPSQQMRKNGAIPMMYREDKPGSDISARGADGAHSLGKSPVNLGLFFDLTKFDEGEHIMAFRLFFENLNDEQRLAAFKSLANWDIEAVRQ